MTSATSPYEVDECRDVLEDYSDGSIVLTHKPSFNVPIKDDGSVILKDVSSDSTHDLSLRVQASITVFN